MPLGALQESVEDLYKQSDGSRLFATRKEGWHRCHVDVPSKGVERLRRLPTDPTKHLRGFVEFRFAYYMFGGDNDPLPLRSLRSRLHSKQDRPKAVVFHSKPTDDVYSDIPDRIDLYLFLKHRHEQTVAVGRDTIAVLEKDERTVDLIVRLWEWEADHPYHLTRIKKRPRRRKLDATEVTEEMQAYDDLSRYAAAALRGVGLEWPGKKSKRRKLWPDCFRDLGVVVTTHDRILKPANS